MKIELEPSAEHEDSETRRQLRSCLVGLSLTIMLAVALSTFGCASPPIAEKKAAEEAVSAARAAGTDTYAPGEFRAATDALKAAEVQVGAKKYDEAKAAYVKATEPAGKAVEAGKAARKAQVTQQLAEAEKRWQELEGRAKPIMKRLSPEQKRAWKADANTVAEALQRARASAGDDPAGAKEKLVRVTVALDAWESELPGLAASAKRAKRP